MRSVYFRILNRYHFMKSQTTLIVFVVLLLAGVSAQSQTVAQWRGANRDGIYHESGLLKTWPAEGPKLLWETEAIGNGYGSPMVWNNKVYVNGEIDSIGYLFSFDFQGKLLTKIPYGREFVGEGFSAGFPGPRSSVTIYNGLVYLCSAMGRIVCFDAETGKEIWAKEMVADFGGMLSYFGYCESLLVDEKVVYCFPGGMESNIVALDRFTGNVVWTSKALADNVAYTSPIIINLPERNVFVTMSKNNLLALDTKNGELLWSIKEDSVKQEGKYCNTPIYDNGFLYTISGVDYGTGASKLQLAPDGKSVSNVWRNNNIKNETGGFLKVNNNLYVTTKDNKLKALDTTTGEVVDSLRNIRGSVIFADNRLYCYTDNGNMNLIGFTDDKMAAISKFKIEKGTKEHMAHPVISNGVLYVRHGKALMAYQIN